MNFKKYLIFGLALANLYSTVYSKSHQYLIWNFDKTQIKSKTKKYEIWNIEESKRKYKKSKYNIWNFDIKNIDKSKNINQENKNSTNNNSKNKNRNNPNLEMILYSLTPAVTAMFIE